MAEAWVAATRFVEEVQKRSGSKGPEEWVLRLDRVGGSCIDCRPKRLTGGSVGGKREGGGRGS